MKPEITIVLASAGLSLVISYAWWTKVRVWMLRQKLFAIRDVLWDEMRNKDLLNAPAYRRGRENINALIHLAPGFSFVVLAKILSAGIRRKPAIHETIPEVDTAITEAVRAVAHYLLRWTLAGWILTANLMLFDLVRPAYNQITTWLDRIAESEEIGETAKEIDDTCIA